MEDLMGNQQLNTLDDRIKLLARNGRLGDGSLWKHPNGRNYKLINTSTKPEILSVKQGIAPEIFKTGIRSMDLSKARGRFANAKPMFRLASTVHPIFTEYKTKSHEEIFSELKLDDFILWFVDDGCVYQRKDSNSKRYILCIGPSISTESRREALSVALHTLFGPKFGRFEKNNSKATIDNMSWFPPTWLGRVFVDGFESFKRRYGRSPETSSL